MTSMSSWKDAPLFTDNEDPYELTSFILNEKHKAVYSSEFIWRVDNFMERLSHPIIAQSPIFVLGPSSWRLDMIHAQSNRSRISVIANRLTIAEECTLKFTLRLKDIPQYFDDDDPHIQVSVIFGVDTTSQVIERLFSLEQIEQKAQDIDLLDLHCAVFVSCSTSLSHEPLLLSQHLQNLCDPSTASFYDVILVVNGVEFPAHKSILSARSPVMKAMFCSKMNETAQNRVVIQDIDTDVFKEMLSYIYTGQNNYNVMINKPQEILVVADQYDLPGLKAKCEDVLAKAVTTNNAITLLKFADLNCAPILKRHLFHFIIDNLMAVFCTPDFLELCKTDVVLLEQLHRAVASLQQSYNVISSTVLRKERKSRFNPYRRNSITSTNNIETKVEYSPPIVIGAPAAGGGQM